MELKDMMSHDKAVTARRRAMMATINTNTSALKVPWMSDVAVDGIGGFAYIGLRRNMEYKRPPAWPY